LRKVAAQGTGTATPNRRQWRQRLDKSAPTAPREGRLTRRVRAERRWPQLTAGESADRRGLRRVGRCLWRRHRAGCGPAYDYAPTDWRAGCGRSARPVRREGLGSIPGPYLYRWELGKAAGWSWSGPAAGPRGWRGWVPGAERHHRPRPCLLVLRLSSVRAPTAPLRWWLNGFIARFVGWIARPISPAGQKAVASASAAPREDTDVTSRSFPEPRLATRSKDSATAAAPRDKSASGSWQAADPPPRRSCYPA
jgi:hypothetical protein